MLTSSISPSSPVKKLYAQATTEAPVTPTPEPETPVATPAPATATTATTSGTKDEGKIKNEEFKGPGLVGRFFIWVLGLDELRDMKLPSGCEK